MQERMGSNAGQDPELQVAELLQEIRDGMLPITRRLAAAGFDDIRDAELLVLLAPKPSKEGSGNALRIAGVPDKAAGVITEALLSRGYLERRKSPAPGPEVITTGMRGAAVRRIVNEELQIRRWADFLFRPGDIVINSNPKSGTTWVQMICALLIFQTPELPAPLPELSPWLESLLNPRRPLFAQLAAQTRRRFIKTHMPPDEIAINPLATYIAVARHPLDSFLSMQRRFASMHPEQRQRSPREEILRIIDNAEGPLAGHMRVLSQEWAHRHDANFVLTHYEDLLADLEGQMRGLAARLGITVPEAIWPGLVKAATFDQMRAAADRIRPVNTQNPADFFWKGTSGSGRALLTDAELARYHQRAAQLAPAELLAWLHR
jgi:hypothetical protein